MSHRSNRSTDDPRVKVEDLGQTSVPAGSLPRRSTDFTHSAGVKVEDPGETLVPTQPALPSAAEGDAEFRVIEDTVIGHWQFKFFGKGKGWYIAYTNTSTGTTAGPSQRITELPRATLHVLEAMDIFDFDAMAVGTVLKMTAHVNLLGFHSSQTINLYPQTWRENLSAFCESLQTFTLFGIQDPMLLSEADRLQAQQEIKTARERKLIAISSFVKLGLELCDPTEWPTFVQAFEEKIVRTTSDSFRNGLFRNIDPHMTPQPGGLSGPPTLSSNGEISLAGQEQGLSHSQSQDPNYPHQEAQSWLRVQAMQRQRQQQQQMLQQQQR